MLNISWYIYFQFLILGPWTSVMITSSLWITSLMHQNSSPLFFLMFFTLNMILPFILPSNFLKINTSKCGPGIPGVAKTFRGSMGAKLLIFFVSFILNVSPVTVGLSETAWQVTWQHIECRHRYENPVVLYKPRN